MGIKINEKVRERNQFIINECGNTKNQFLKLGEYFEEIKEQRLYKLLDYRTFEEYIRQPEITIKRTIIYAMMAVWKIFVRDKGCEISFLLKVGYPKLSKLGEIKNHPDFGKFLSIADIITFDVFKEQIKKVKVNKHSKVSQEMLIEEAKNVGMGICAICKKKRFLIEHHVCYKPCYTILICKVCHQLCHRQVTQINNKGDKTV